MSKRVNGNVRVYCMSSRYAQVRALLDYSFHQKYPLSRQLVQDAIVDRFLNDCPKNMSSPHMILMAGGIGSGKSHVIHKKLGRDYCKYVVADVDKIKDYIPEVHQLRKTDPLKAGIIMHPEATTIHEIIFRCAVAQRSNVIIDGTLKDAQFFKEFLMDLRHHTSYKIELVHVKASLAKCLERAERRAKQTGRVVPQSVIEESLKESIRSVKILHEVVDCVIEIDNEMDDPHLTP